MISRFIKKLFGTTKAASEPAVVSKMEIPTAPVGHNLCATPLICQKCGERLPLNRKSYCNNTCKNGDTEGLWNKHLKKGSVPKAERVVRVQKVSTVVPSCMINPAIAYPEQNEDEKHPTGNATFKESEHRKKIKEFSKW